jgi:nitrous oxidase accessory protein NosD
LNVILSNQPIEAIGFIAQRSLSWPDEYRQNWWADMKAIR